MRSFLSHSNFRDPKRILTALTVIALACLSISELLIIYFESTISILISRCAFILLIVSLAPFFKLREWVLTLFAALLIIGLWSKPDGQEDLLFALDRAAFFAAFIYLVTLLKEAAQGSASVLKLGVYLTRQPPQQRYYSLAFGGHLLGTLLNFGAVSLLTPLIQRGARGGEGESRSPNQVLRLEQQQISAMIRGFSWMIMWSPTALTQAVLFTSFPGADLSVVIPLGILASIVMILIGRMVDRHEWRNTEEAPATTQLAFPKRSAVRFMLVSITLIISTFLVVVMADVSAAVALMLTAPIIMMIWVFEQGYNGDFSKASKQCFSSLGEIFVGSSGTLGRSAFTLGIAGFIGVSAAKLAPVDLLAGAMQSLDLPVWLFLISLPIIITLCGQIALSPILIVVFLSSIFNQLPVLPADPTLIVFALGAGWALSMSASPNASATLLISGVTGIAPTTLTWRWNGRYSIVCFVVFFVSFYFLALFYPAN
jgi:hypothetical protein